MVMVMMKKTHECTSHDIFWVREVVNKDKSDKIDSSKLFCTALTFNS